METSQTVIPHPANFTPAPLRHRLRLALDASPAEVWAVVGPHVRMPEYAAGVSAVELTRDADGARYRICHFRAPDGSPGPRLREQLRWESAGVGYATTAVPGNPFGLENCLELVFLLPAPAGTFLTWEEYYDNADLETARASFDEGLADIGRRVVERLGGRILERSNDLRTREGARAGS